MNDMAREGFSMFNAEYREGLRRNRQWFDGPAWVALFRILDARIRVTSFEWSQQADDLFYHQVRCARRATQKAAQQASVQRCQVSNRENHGAYKFANRRQVYTVPRASIFFVVDDIKADMVKWSVSGEMGREQWAEVQATAAARRKK
jgi:hypothetical protein